MLLSCDRAVQLVAARNDVTAGKLTDSYLLLLHTIATNGAQPQWLIMDAVLITDIPAGATVTLSLEDCILTGLANDMMPVAVSTRSDGPLTPNQVWAIDESTSRLAELAIDPAWTCLAVNN